MGCFQYVKFIKFESNSQLGIGFLVHGGQGRTQSLGLLVQLFDGHLVGAEGSSIGIRLLGGGLQGRVVVLQLL